MRWNMKSFVANSFLSASCAILICYQIKSKLYSSTDAIITVSLKFFAAARIKEIPPMSFFHTIHCSQANCFFKRYKSTITKSIWEYQIPSFVEHHFHYLDRYHLKTFGCNVLLFRLRWREEVTSSTAVTGMPKFF
jgi:hypothetical protein